MKYDKSLVITWVKSMGRTEPMPLDQTSVWNTKSEADTYATEANAYGGQIVTAKVDDKFKAYILQPSEAGYVLEDIGVDASSVKQYVIIGTRPDSGQEQGVIYIDNNVGYIWNGSAWVKVFEDFSDDISDFESRIGTLETDIALKAPLASPNFTGTVSVEGNEVATQTWVNSLIAQLNTGVPGIVDGTENVLPTEGYKAGQMWRVAVAGTYAGQDCETGDLILCIKDFDSAFANEDFMVVQANIDGAVTGPDASTDGHIVVFDGATGKIIKDSAVSITSLNEAISKAHEHTNKTILDSYDKTQTELLEAASTDAASKVSALESTINESLALKANAADVYDKTTVDSKIDTLTTAVNSKITASEVDTKISTAKEEITGEYTAAISSRIGDIPEDQSVREYIDLAVGSGGADVAEEIAQAKTEAIASAKEYTDSMLEIIEI